MNSIRRIHLINSTCPKWKNLGHIRTQNKPTVFEKVSCVSSGVVVFAEAVTAGHEETPAQPNRGR